MIREFSGPLDLGTETAVETIFYLITNPESLRSGGFVMHEVLMSCPQILPLPSD
jgi:hypothetical protein